MRVKAAVGCARGCQLRRLVPGCLEGLGAIPSINGHAVISRADMAARGVARSTADLWYRNRTANGYPEKAGRIGRTDYWYEDEWAAWLRAHQQGKIASLTEVDFGGDADELVDAAGAARIMGWSGRDVVHHNRRLGYFPEPDAWGTASNGRPAPLWRRSTVWAAAGTRKGMGGGHKPGTPGAPSKPHPYAGDARLTAVLAQLRSGGHVSSDAGRRLGRQPADCRTNHPRRPRPPRALKRTMRHDAVCQGLIVATPESC